MVFSEVIGAITVLAGLYYIGIIISRCILLSARKMEVDLAEKEINIRKEQLKLLEGEVHELDIISEGDEELKEESRKIKKEKLEVIIGGKIEPRNRW
jgi:hypothetical protein